MKGTIRQLLEKPEVQDISNKEVYERLAKASLSVEENKLKDMIYHNFIIEINNDSDEQDIQLTTVRKKRLIAFLNNEVVHDYLMSSSGPVERILYFYNYVLQKGHQTPRYIIRDIIEPVVRDAIFNKESFPSVDIDVVNVNQTLSFRIHSQVSDEKTINRILKFMSVWGNGKPDQYEENGRT